MSRDRSLVFVSGIWRDMACLRLVRLQGKKGLSPEPLSIDIEYGSYGVRHVDI